MKKAAIATLGCKVNQVETSSIVQQLKERNYQIVDFQEAADIYIINTCTVTNRTDFKSRNLIRHALAAKESNPDVKIIVTGCYAQKERDEITALGEIDLVVDNQSKVDLHVWLDNAEYSFADISQADKLLWKPLDDMHERTRAFIKIQDGCDYYCTYCAVPYGRGKPRSMGINDVISQTRQITAHGYREVVLTGINLGLYEDKQSGAGLAEIIKALVEIDNFNLLRISSIEPDLWTDKLIEAVGSSDKVCPHFHIPLQSGSDSVLQRMGRKYRAEQVKNIIDRLEQAKPCCAIGLDVICGFPGETEAEFAETYNFLSGLPITYLHVFGYSKRSKTTAAKMPEQVHGDIAKHRVKTLTELSKAKKEQYLKRLMDAEVEIRGVIENKEGNLATALSDHYLRIYLKTEDIEINEIVSGRVVTAYKDGVLIQSDLC